MRAMEGEGGWWQSLLKARGTRRESEGRGAHEQGTRQNGARLPVDQRRPQHSAHRASDAVRLQRPPLQ